MNIRRIALLVAAAAVGLGGAAYAGLSTQQTPVTFFQGHFHTPDGRTVNAPSHSGGTDAYGCHNASVPYHCH